jgi:hypothetical protein
VANIGADQARAAATVERENRAVPAARSARWPTTGWSLGMLALDSLTPSLLHRLYDWLTEIETARYAQNFRDRRRPFGDAFSYDQIDSLESDLRTGFLSFCNRTPALAVEYLRSVITRPYNDNITRSILKFRGKLAQAGAG